MSRESAAAWESRFALGEQAEETLAADHVVRRLLVFSDRPLGGCGILGLMPASDRGEATSSFQGLATALETPADAVIVDADAAARRRALELIGDTNVPLVILLRDPACEARTPELERAAALLARDELDDHVLATVLDAVTHGLRVLPAELPLVLPDQRARCGPPPGDRAMECLRLLSEGCRDIEIAEELHLSESAARKLVQRAVRDLHARTRCQAVVKAIDAGILA